MIVEKHDMANKYIYFNTKKYHVFAPMGRFQLESIYLYFPPSSELAGTTVENKGKLILTLLLCSKLQPEMAATSTFQEYLRLFPTENGDLDY